MKLLLTIRDEDVLAGDIEIPVGEFKLRKAARAVLLDDNDFVYLLDVAKQGYHKLPGGGIEEGEDIETALSRELLEEVGCEAKIIAAIGEIKEYRSFQKLDHTSYCYLARQVGTKQASALEEDELADGMQEMKARNIDDAIMILQQDTPHNDAGRFIQRRDICFLLAAKKLIERKK